MGWKSCHLWVTLPMTVAVSPIDTGWVTLPLGETSAWVFNTALLRQDADGLDEGQKYLQNTSFFRGKTH